MYSTNAGLTLQSEELGLCAHDRGMCCDDGVRRHEAEIQVTFTPVR